MKASFTSFALLSSLIVGAAWATIPSSQADASYTAPTYPKYDVSITYDVVPADEYLRFCPMKLAFSAEVEVKLPPGAPQELTYHWENAKGRHWPDHVMKLDTQHDPTLGAGVLQTSNQQSGALRFHMSHPFRDTLSFVITKPVKQVTKTAALDILCH